MEIRITNISLKEKVYKFFGAYPKDEIILLLGSEPKVKFGCSTTFIFAPVITMGHISFYLLDEGGNLLKFENGDLVPHSHEEIRKALLDVHKDNLRELFRQF